MPPLDLYTLRVTEHAIARITRYVSGAGIVERWIAPVERAEESVLERWREEHRRALGWRPSWQADATSLAAPPRAS